MWLGALLWWSFYDLAVRLWMLNFTCKYLRNSENKSVQQLPDHGSSITTMHRATPLLLSWTSWPNMASHIFPTHPTAQMSLPQTSSSSLIEKGHERMAPWFGPDHPSGCSKGAEEHSSFCVAGSLQWFSRIADNTVLMQKGHILKTIKLMCQECQYIKKNNLFLLSGWTLYIYEYGKMQKPVIILC